LSEFSNAVFASFSNHTAHAIVNAGAKKSTRVPLRLQSGHKDFLFLVGFYWALQPHASPVAHCLGSSFERLIHLPTTGILGLVLGTLSSHFLSVPEWEHIQLSLVEVILNTTWFICRIALYSTLWCSNVSRILVISHFNLLWGFIILMGIGLTVFINILSQVVLPIDWFFLIFRKI